MWIFAGYWRRRELNATSVYVDSNVFITPLLYDAPRSEAAAAVLKMIETKKISAYTSTLTWDEVVWVVRRTLGKADSIEAGKKLLGFPNLRFIPTSEEVVRGAQSLVADWDLDPRDAIHIASALNKRVDVLVSDDSDLNVPTGLRRVSTSSFIK